MLAYIITRSIHHRYLVLAVTFLLAIIGAFSYQHLVIDAVPDITNVQVQINTSAPGMSPFEVEQRITVPLELAMAGIPALEYTRSLSRYGLSQLTVVFREGTDIYFARNLVTQRVGEARERLPVGIAPSLGPIATGLGEILMYTVGATHGSARSLQELRDVQDWIVKPQLRTVTGVSEVNSIGGASKQIVIAPNSSSMRAYGFSFDRIADAVTQGTQNVGAGFIEQNGEQFLIRVPSQPVDYRELETLVVGVHNSLPVYLKDVASVSIGSELRGGAATQNGEEVVLGTVFMLMGENGLEVAQRVGKKIKEIQTSLPEGVELKILYDRSVLVSETVHTVQKNLLEGALLVVVILFIALGNLRAALITACVIPLVMVLTIFGMVQSGMSANLMSLGALDFGLIVDGAVILVENCIRRLTQAQKRGVVTEAQRLKIIEDATIEVRQATMFGELIIMVVYIPILSLTGVEGKMFHPMALTVILALFLAFIASLIVVPAAVAAFLKSSKKSSDPVVAPSSSGEFAEDEHPVSGVGGAVIATYQRALEALFKAPKLVLVVTVSLLIGGGILFMRLGAEFIPHLDEGDIALHALRVPGTSLSQAISMQHQLEEEIQKLPEVSHTFTKLGTAEIATDPMPPSVADGFIILKPRREWPNPTKPKSEVIAELERIVMAVPGNNYEFTQPIQMRFNELIAGVRSDVAVKIFGDDATVLNDQAKLVHTLLMAIPGASDVKVEQTTGLPVVNVIPNREAVGRFGITTHDVQSVVAAAYAGREVGRFYQGDRNYPITLRLDERERQDLRKIAELPIALPFSGEEPKGEFDTVSPLADPAPSFARYITVGQVATLSVGEGPNQISRENGKRRIVVTANVRGRDLGSFVDEAQAQLSQKIRLPAGYWLSWGGQFENLLSAKARLQIIVPLVIVGVFGLIYVTFRNLTAAALVFTGVPFALTGGVFALWLREIPFSISAAVGFIALSGISVLNGLVLLSFARARIEGAKDVDREIIKAACLRFRPVVMTALVASLGFLPMAISQGTGSEVQRPLATVVIGGIVSSTVLTLCVLPLLLSLCSRKRRNEGVE